MSDTDAELSFMTLLEVQPMYGVELYKCHFANGSVCKLGFDSQGIKIYRPNVRAVLLALFCLRRHSRCRMPRPALPWHVAVTSWLTAAAVPFLMQTSTTESFMWQNLLNFAYNKKKLSLVYVSPDTLDEISTVFVFESKEAAKVCGCSFGVPFLQSAGCCRGYTYIPSLAG